MPIVYGANASPFVRKVRVVLAEKGIPYELEPVFPGPGITPEFRQMSPLGKIPAFRDGERTLADSSVIIAYLERTHPTPPLYPSEAYDYARSLWFEEYADGGLIAQIGTIFFQRIVGPRFFGRPTDEEAVNKAITEGLPPMLAYLEGQLSGDFLVGKTLTVGDVAVGSMFVNLRHCGMGVDAAQYPKLAAYVGRLHARPSFTALIDEEAPQFNS